MPNQWDGLKLFYRPMVQRDDFSSLSRDARWQQFRSNIEADQTPFGLAALAAVNGIGKDEPHRDDVIEYLEHTIGGEAVSS